MTGPGAPKLAIIAKLHAHPGRGDDVIAAFEAAAPFANAEPGTELFLVHRDDTEPDVLWVYELYAGKDAFDAHVADGRAMPKVRDLIATHEIARIPVAAGKGS